MGLGSTLTRSFRQLSPISMKKASMQASTHTSPFCSPIVETTLDLWWNVRGVRFLWRERTLPLNRSRGARECPSIPACMSNSSRWTSCQKSRNSPTQRWRRKPFRSCTKNCKHLAFDFWKAISPPAGPETNLLYRMFGLKEQTAFEQFCKKAEEVFRKKHFSDEEEDEEIWRDLNVSAKITKISWFPSRFLHRLGLLEAHKSASEPTVWKISASLRCRHFHHCNHSPPSPHPHHRRTFSYHCGRLITTRTTPGPGKQTGWWWWWWWWHHFHSGAFLFQHIFESEMRSSLD